MATLEDLETTLLSNPAARARFLADTLELFEKNGVDVNTAFSGAAADSFDLTDGARFLGGLAASSVVITRSSTGRGVGDLGGNPAASTLVITRSSTGRGVGDLGANPAASTLVITRSSTGRGVGDLGTVASTVVITRSSTGRLANIANQLKQVAQALESESLELNAQEEALRNAGS
ncbi:MULTISPECIES: hypothetical protein [unclassified Nitrobacter]|jgi:hypothetical protein|uniref:hypothetical protein n=1 Tax=unclassified Nitrobacter TaxID=2620411 RepID=UPI000925E80D|nr:MULTISPECIES: hypothetical protein [unclassified Nitrobacter]MBN9148349.1 hypothetical protein [Nitrobacter sp.]OJV03424.1 MAG: hypothetical protein BGO16_17625 [Nitrobacter sp. 62-23]